MRKTNLHNQITDALEAAAVFSSELETLLLQSKNSGEPTRELGLKICAAERGWMKEMGNHSSAIKELRNRNEEEQAM
jgi:hypothetical protein